MQTLKNGEIFAHARFFFMKRSFNNVYPVTKAFVAGGILKYKSGQFANMHVGAAYYASCKVGGIFSREEGIRTSLLQKDRSDIHFLGEAYLDYDFGGTNFIIERQRLDTPIIGGLYLREVPTVYEAVVLRGKTASEIGYEIGYVRSFSGFGSKYSGFVRSWGKRGLGYLYLYSHMHHCSIRAQFVKAFSRYDNSGAFLSIRDYKYMDMKYTLPFSTPTHIYLQLGGNAYSGAADSWLFGLKIDTQLLANTKISLFYDKIVHNNFEVVMASPMYTDWQQGYGVYEPSDAGGIGVVVKPIHRLRLASVFVLINSDTPKLIDDYITTMYFFFICITFKFCIIRHNR